MHAYVCTYDTASTVQQGTHVCTLGWTITVYLLALHKLLCDTGYYACICTYDTASTVQQCTHVQMYIRVHSIYMCVASGPHYTSFYVIIVDNMHAYVRICTYVLWWQMLYMYEMVNGMCACM